MSKLAEWTKIRTESKPVSISTSRQEPVSSNAYRKEILILLSAYQSSSRFLRQQIESIQNQSYSHWQLIVRDDGSTDCTSDVLEEYLKQDSRIHRIQDDSTHGRDSKRNLGTIRSFDRLLQKAIELDGHYFAFCDHDDLWFEDKLMEQQHRMTELENTYGSHIPFLVHSDMQIIDAEDRTISDSFWSYQKLNPYLNNPLETLLVQNYVTGCSMMINRPLAQIACPVPDQAVVHDWWLALCAASWGKIESVRKPLMGYRQHQSNQIGAQGFWKMLCYKPPKSLFGKEGLRQLQATLNQCRELYLRMQEWHAPDIQSNFVRDYLEAFSPNNSSLKRWNAFRKLKIRRQDWIRNSLLSLRILLGSTPDMEL